MRPDTPELQWTTTPPIEPGWYWRLKHGFPAVVEIVTKVSDDVWRNVKAGDLAVYTDQGEYPIVGFADYWWPERLSVPAPPA